MTCPRVIPGAGSLGAAELRGILYTVMTLRLTSPGIRILLVVLGLTASVCSQSYTTYLDLVYGSYQDRSGQTQTLKLNLFVPNSASGPVPLVVHIHEGGWSWADGWACEGGGLEDLANQLWTDD